MAFNIIFCVLFLLEHVHCDKSHTPAFLVNEHEQDRVQFGIVGSDYHSILIDENIQDPITVAFINYTGMEPPTVTKFLEPNAQGNYMLGATLEHPMNDSLWGLTITIPQDYDDKPEGFRYVFEITLDSRSHFVFLYIRNIDDEAPVIQIPPKVCKIKENSIELSNCIYTITDADGIINNIVKYELLGEGGVEEMFMFTNTDRLQNGMKKWDVVLNMTKPLDYELQALHVFDLIVEDSGGNRGIAKIVVQVIDVSDEGLVWTKTLAFKQFSEKLQQEFQFEAKTGDANAEINYMLRVTNWTNLFSIATKTGVLTVYPIDRDYLQQELFTFEVIAFEVGNLSVAIVQQVTILVEDINDHGPQILTDKNVLSIPEGTSTVLDIEILVHDSDLGNNARYEVYLEDNYHSKAFQIVPNKGYQDQTFFISVVNSSLLDYEDETWREITLEIKSKETFGNTYTDSKTVRIFLENWNDEFPIFEQDEYVAAVSENIGKDTVFNQVTALDRDIGEWVRYSLVGRTANEKFSIDERGLVWTKVDNAFHYKEPLVTIVVQAEDALGGVHHQTFASIAIFVQDVNDDPPVISVPSGPLTVEEHRLDGTLINEHFEITAIDENLSAELQFSINWNESYALKNNQLVSKEYYVRCIEVVTKGGVTNQQASALLIIQEIMLFNTPDYELYDTLYLSLIVEDMNQNLGSNADYGIITINIKDVNDNAPVFELDTINSHKYVIEHATENTLIANIMATDADGPAFNFITYSLRPLGTTPKDWIAVDEYTGHLFVASAEIDADLPVYTLEYAVQASDGEYLVEAAITVEVVDINDNHPELGDNFADEIYVSEKSPNGTIVQIIMATDNDRDEPYNTPWFALSKFATREVKQLFSIDTFSGTVYVDYKGTDMLDRDFGTKEFIIPFIIGDNYESIGPSKQQNIIAHSFVVKLMDVNDHAPIILTRSFDTTDNLEKGAIVGIVEAVDYDEPETDNTRINFSILEITKSEGATIDPPADLFNISPDPDPFSGKAMLIAGCDLMGYYGNYDVIIQTYDHGVPVQSTTTAVAVNIKQDSSQ